MSHFGLRHPHLQPRRRGAVLAECAAALDAWCARVNPGLRIAALALALALLSPAIITQSPPSWVISVEALTDVAPSANPQWP